MQKQKWKQKIKMKCNKEFKCINNTKPMMKNLKINTIKCKNNTFNQEQTRNKLRKEQQRKRKSNNNLD